MNNITTVKLDLPIPGKCSAVLLIPRNINNKEWLMISRMLDVWVAAQNKLKRKYTGRPMRI